MTKYNRIFIYLWFLAPQPVPYNVIMQSPPAPAAPTIINVSNNSHAKRNLSKGACAACNTGILRTNYSLCAWCVCCLFFPCGILCCLCMSRKKCSHCGVVYWFKKKKKDYYFKIQNVNYVFYEGKCNQG